MSTVNSDLQTALQVSRNNVPAPPNPGQTDSQAPLPGAGNQKPVQGLPDIKDKTSQGTQPPANQQQQTPPVNQDENTVVPRAELLKERAKRQELETMVRQGNQTNQQQSNEIGQLKQQLATMMGQLNTLTNQQTQAVQAAQQANQQPTVVPDPLAEPEAWSEWLMTQVRQETFNMVKNLGMDIFNQRMRHYHEIHEATHGPQKVAEATTWVNQTGKLNEAMAHYDPTGWAIREYNRAKGMERLPQNPQSGEFDWNQYNTRVVTDFLKSPQYQQFLANQAAQQQGQPPQQQQPGQQLPQMQFPNQQPAAPTQPQAPNIPQSMAGQSGGGQSNVVAMPSVNQSLQGALRDMHAAPQRR